MTEPAYVTATRISYDTVAADYATLLGDALAAMPFDRAMLGAFAEQVRADGGGPVADMGCGPGRLTGHLRDLGLDVFGIDLSPGMIDVARRAHPGLRFDVGSITGLDLADGTLGGIVAWYSIIHTPRELLPGIFAEFHRVLAPGGHLVLAFKIGEERVELTHAYGHDLSLHVYRWTPGRLAELLSRAGLTVGARLVREPDARERTPQGYLLARKPAAGRAPEEGDPS
ncbi:class I SAM-dependent DNA methyltransferase [Streptomyces pinistramenti]|uniref:class I SAM-dependent DNA methyltransferase n=1 Tax=Streptomyces pinistramenti TaxID=2884812 RepID=UPI001D05D600|nr:class I SAM-dependent methyltransferase [Streptomyces pinistramenti]MCB5907429.1 class I SAM-dependent methyltransferase [Streptomyces pinistramenti]